MKRIKGKDCAYPMSKNDTACMSNPCWSNGTCINFNTEWRCICKYGTTGNNCRILESSIDYGALIMFTREKSSIVTKKCKYNEFIHIELTTRAINKWNRLLF